MSISIAAIASGGGAKRRTINPPIASLRLSHQSQATAGSCRFDLFAKPSINDRYLRAP
jgi:hypothetical protein